MSSTARTDALLIALNLAAVLSFFFYVVCQVLQRSTKEASEQTDGLAAISLNLV